MSILQHHEIVRDRGSSIDYRAWVEQLINQVPPPYGETSGKKVLAYVNHGRWVGECPYGDGGAMLLQMREPFFICPECGNWRDQGKWHEVTIPKDAVRIEKLLLARPDSVNRNWLPGETAKDLLRENKERGL